MTTVLSPVSVRRRFLVLTFLRWLPVGLLIPLIVLLPLDRGLSLSQVGLAASLQGLVVLALELPTGGLADALGRRPVLLVAGVVGIASITWMFFAQDVSGFAAAYALQGVYRALDSGPLESWYVDASQAADPEVEIERGLSGAGVVLGVAVSAGALASGGLIALGDLGPVSALSVPLLVSLAIQVVALLCVALLLLEPPRGDRAGGAAAAVRAARQAPGVIRDGVRLLRSSRVLLALVAVEICWGFGSMTYEGLLPVRLTEILTDPERAAVITGPAGSVAWHASAAGAACTPWLGRRLGIAPTAAALRVVQGLAVAMMGLLGGVVGVVTAYLACYAVHGASNPAHMTLLHRQVDGSLRTTVVSMNSMLAQPAGAAGLIALTSVAEGTSASVAMLLGGAVLAVAAPLYLPAWRAERARRSGGTGVDGDDPGATGVSSAPEASARA